MATTCRPGARARSARRVAQCASQASGATHQKQTRAKQLCRNPARWKSISCTMILRSRRIRLMSCFSAPRGDSGTTLSSWCLQPSCRQTRNSPGKKYPPKRVRGALACCFPRVRDPHFRRRLTHPYPRARHWSCASACRSRSALDGKRVKEHENRQTMPRSRLTPPLNSVACLDQSRLAPRGKREVEVVEHGQRHERCRMARGKPN